MNQLAFVLRSLKSPVFARLYLAQTINLVGDALTWLGLALLAFELAGESSGTVLATALTLRVVAYVILSPIAGVLADRVDRKRLMIATHLARMGIVCLLPLVTQVWQIYTLVLLLNGFSAFFTPTYTATIPLVTSRETYSQAIALSSATYQLLGVLGPGLAGGIAALVGTRAVFFLDGVTFLVAAILIAILPGQLLVSQGQGSRTVLGIWKEIQTGSICLFADPLIRYALVMQFIAAIAGAEILVNTVSYVQGALHLGKLEYSWLMAAFGLGATLASVGLGNFQQKISPVLWISVGTILITMALLPANLVNLSGLLLLWAIVGVGQTLVNVPTQTLIADRFAVEMQGRVYGAHFAWSHLWWAIGYPLAGWMGSRFPSHNFFYSSLMGSVLLVIVYLAFKPQNLTSLDRRLWHEHNHMHDEHHRHDHSPSATIQDSHNHLHFHPVTQQEFSHQQ